jgi:CRISPR-associated protein Csx14
MTTPVPSWSITVDVMNPGQFFACCGLLELAHRLWPGAEAWFEGGDFNLMLSPATPCNGVECLLRALVTCNLRSEQIQASTTVKRWKGRDSEKIMPIRLESPYDLRLDWWISDGQANTLKLWSGRQSPQDIIPKLQKAISSHCDDTVSLFDRTAPLRGRFGVDPRSAWKAMDVGFSPDAQGVEVDTYPIVELLAAVGLQRFRPLQNERKDKGIVFRYATWRVPLPATIGAATCIGLISTAIPHWFEFRLVYRGKYKGFDYAIPVGDEL